MQAFLSGLLLACVSAVTVFAFRHPVAYGRLFPYAISATTVVFLLLTVWCVAVEVAWSTLLPFVKHQALRAAQSSKAGLGLPWVVIGVTYVGVCIFLWINQKLPRFIRDTERNRNRMSKPDRPEQS